MTLGKTACASAPAATPQLERFHDFAHKQLMACPPCEKGRCAWPDCSARFEPTSYRQIYCSTSCRKKDDAEHRRIGDLIARPALLARTHKHAKAETPEKALASAARTFQDRTLSAWRISRNQRKAHAEAGRCI